MIPFNDFFFMYVNFPWTTHCALNTELYNHRAQRTVKNCILYFDPLAIIIQDMTNVCSRYTNKNSLSFIRIVHTLETIHFNSYLQNKLKWEKYVAVGDCPTLKIVRRIKRLFSLKYMLFIDFKLILRSKCK